MLKDFFQLYRFNKKYNIKRAKKNVEIYNLFKKRLNIKTSVNDINILDIGCGKTYPYSYLMSLEGYNTTALDTQYVNDGIFKYFYMLFNDGVKVTLKTIFRDTLFKPNERKILNESIFNKKEKKIKFVCASAEKLPFEEKSFDIIFSINAFEHIKQLDLVLSECSRVLKNDGIMYITFHLYTSISGAHHPDWFYPNESPPKNIPPWFHLRGMEKDYMHNLDYNLNRLRLKEYIDIFNKHSVILEEFYDEIQGENFLTNNIRSQLADYSDKELLTSSVTLIAKKII